MKKRLLYLSIAFLCTAILALIIVAMRSLYPRLLPLSPWYNPIQSRFYHNLYHISAIFHLFDNSRNQP